MPSSRAEWPSTPRSASRRRGDLARAAAAAATVTQVQTAMNPVPLQTASIRPVAAVPAAQSPSVRSGFGAGRWLLAGAAFVVCAAALGLVLWFALGQNRSGEVAAPPPTPPATQPASTSASPVALPGTDAQGFIDYPGARCDAGSGPAALARTTQS